MRENLIRDYYKKRIKNSDEDYQILGWESEEAHEKRFKVFLDCFDLNNRKILDVGCGVGSFFNYLNKNNIIVDYTGVDILPEMIQIAKARNPECKFHCVDIFKEDDIFKKGFDYIYSSGIFNLNLGNNIEFIKSAVKSFVKMSKYGFSFNLLNDDSNNKEDTYFYISYYEATELVASICDKNYNIKVVRGYLQNDYTLIVKKYSSFLL